jgi:uncharacterized protein (DUF2336 family)
MARRGARFRKRQVQVVGGGIVIEREVEALARAALQKPPQQRQAIAGTIATMLIDRDRKLTEKVRGVVAHVIQPLVADIESTLRRELAEELAGLPDAGTLPASLFVMLANDTIEVAHPLLSRSPILRDPDLIAVVRERSSAHRVAIAQRPDLSDAVTGALLDAAEAEVVSARLANRKAVLSPRMIERIVMLSQRMEVIQPPLLQRRELPAGLAYRMFWWVGGALRRHILQRFDVSPDMIDRAVTRVVDRRLAENGRLAEEQRRAEQRIAQLSRSGGLTEMLLLQSYRQGEIAMFEAALARMTEIRAITARRIAFETTGQALAIACKAADVTRPGFSTLFMLTRKMSRGTRVSDPKDLLEAVAFFDMVDRRRALAILALWDGDAI